MSECVRRLIGWTALCVLAWAELAWLLWSYVPAHAAVFAQIGTELPLATRIAIVGSFWFVRMIPFVVVSVALLWPLLTGALALVAVLCALWKPALSILVAATVIMSVTALLASAFVVVSIEIAY